MSLVGQRAVRGAHPVEATAAIDRPIVTRLERQDRLAAALRAYRRMHLPRRLLRSRRHPRFVGGAAIRAATGLVLQMLRLEELLFTCRKDKFLSTFPADKLTINKVGHEVRPLFL